MNKIIASGPVIIENNKLLVTLDSKDPFYKIPGGRLKEGESLEECAMRELKEETGFSCEIIRKLSTLNLDKKPGTDEPAEIGLHHYLAKLNNKVEDYMPIKHNGHFSYWMNIEYIKRNKKEFAPNINYLIEKGEIN